MIKILQVGTTTKAEYSKLSMESLQAFMQRQDIGFPNIPNREELWKESQTLALRLQKQFSHLVLVGIGGSSLGVRVLQEVFALKNLHFIDNVDSFDLERTLKQLPLRECLFVFASKSGTTIETLSALEYINLHFNQMSLSLPQQSVVISENKPSSLKNWAVAHHVPSLEIPLDVGGRFSVLTAVGMFPAAFFGLDISAFQRGASEALKAKEEITEMMAQSLMSWDREEWIFALWSYSNRMRFFGAWLQQLWAESLAKGVDRTGKPPRRVSTPLPLVGASDQHSILQQIMEGARDKFVVFHRFEDAESGGLRLAVAQFPETNSLTGRSLGDLLAAEAEATQESLAGSGISTMTLQTKVLDEKSLGFLFMYWQLVVAGLGETINIDAFNQPGVETGKILAKKKLNRDL